MNVSPQLKSQLFTNNAVAHILYSFGRTDWEYQCRNAYELTTEARDNGIWVKEDNVIISYRVLNDFICNHCIAIGDYLNIEKTRGGWLVESVSQPGTNHLVKLSMRGAWICTCMRYRCWKNRLPSELPPFWEVINHQPYCHHISAAYRYKD
jgi:hypothetical protein